MEKVGIYILGLSALCVVEAFTGPSAFGIPPSAGGAIQGAKSPPSGAGGAPPGFKSPPTAAGSKPPSALGGTGPGAAPTVPTGTGTTNLTNPQGIQGAVYHVPLVTSNCTANGNPCTLGGKSCCFSPMFSCQGSPGMCRVAPAHINHIPQIQQYLQTAGYTTPNPIL